MRRYTGPLSYNCIRACTLVLTLAFAAFPLAAGNAGTDVTLFSPHHRESPGWNLSMNVANAARPELPRTFTREELKADLDFLITTLEAVHPRPYTVTSNAQMKRERTSVENRLAKGMTAREFYLLAAPLVAKLGDGHTLLQPPGDDYFPWLQAGGLVFPFDIELKGRKACVTANYSTEPSVAIGDELVAINGVAMPDILAKLLPYSLGEREPFRLEIIRQNIRLFFKVVLGWEGSFDIELRSGGQKRTVRVSGVPDSVITKQQSSSTPKAAPVPYDFEVLPGDTIGFLNIRNFDDRERAAAFFKTTFEEIAKRGIRHLILDLRQNDGGDSLIGDNLLGYLSKKSITQTSRIDVKISTQIQEYYRNPSQSHRKVWHYDAILNAVPGKILTIKEEPIPLQPESLRFNGEVYVLVGRNTYSAAVMFAATIKDHRLGTLIGEETGGLATQFADIYPFTLPNTKLNGIISHKYIVRPSGREDGRGVLPDYLVVESAGEPKNGDNGLQRARSLIEERISRKN